MKPFVRALPLHCPAAAALFGLPAASHQRDTISPPPFFLVLTVRRRLNYTSHSYSTNFESWLLWIFLLAHAVLNCGSVKFAGLQFTLYSWSFDTLWSRTFCREALKNNSDFRNNLCPQRSLQAFSRVSKWTKTLAVPRKNTT